MKIQPKNKKLLLKAALGQIESNLLIKNVQLVNVVTGEIYPANVFVYDNMIAHVEYKDLNSGSAKTIIDGEGKYLIPGFIDAHVHIESSMMTPRNFAKTVVPHGTTTVVTDPHEIGNVFGIRAVKYMHEASEGLPMRQFIDIPSCVPAVPGFENAGATFLAKEVEELCSLERVIGLAEVMDFLGVIEGDDRIMDIIDVAEKNGLYLQGHSPLVSGRMLSAYLIGGPRTCHETGTGEEALEKLRSGMYVDARDSSIVKNVKDIMSGIGSVRFHDYLCICTDDREADEILNEGHINDVVRNAIRCGLDPVVAIRSATLNTAREIHFDNLGAVAPGYVADMLLVDDLRELKPSHVFFEGQLVARDGQLVKEIEDKPYAIEKENSMHVKELTVDDFSIKAPIANGKVKVNVFEYLNITSAITRLSVEEFEVKDGNIILNDENLKFAAVVNRHAGNDNIGLAIVRGFGIKTGTLASTVSHDCHNLTIVYSTPEEALIAANELIACGGGMCAVKDQEVIHTLQLPLAGIISLKPAEELAIDAGKMKEAIIALGLVGMDNPLLRIVTLALPVVPEVKLSDLGIVDVLKKEFIPLFV